MLVRRSCVSLCAMVVLVACGGLATQGAQDAATSQPPLGATPAKRSGPTTSDASTKTFAIQKIYLGETPRTGGNPDFLAWKRFGLNLDGKLTLASSSDVCTRNWRACRIS